MPLHDAGQDSLLGVSYIVMPLYPGADLASVLMRYGPLPFRSARQCVDQVCSALDYLQRRTHAAHGDVKPSNIWLTGSGAALLMDFHLYGVMARGMGRAGTPGYSAPEALRGCQDPRSDVFSAGCVLYEALTGKMAFADDAAVLAGRCIPVDQVRRDIRPDLAAVLSKAMAADPERRYQSPREMQTAVRYPGRGAGVSVLSLMARDTDRLVAWAWRCVIAILGFAGRSGSRFVRRMVRRPVQALVEAAVVGSLTYWAYGQALQWLTVHPHFLRSIGWGVVAALAVAAIIRIAAASRLAMRRR
jgi:hypothetical protein